MEMKEPDTKQIRHIIIIDLLAAGLHLMEVNCYEASALRFKIAHKILTNQLLP